MVCVEDCDSVGDWEGVRRCDAVADPDWDRVSVWLGDDDCVPDGTCEGLTEAELVTEPVTLPVSVCDGVGARLGLIDAV